MVVVSVPLFGGGEPAASNQLPTDYDCSL
jgi:hypothetical protein